MVANAQCSSENAENEEGLRGGLVLHIVGNRVWQKESGLEVDLGQDQGKKDRGICRLANRIKVGGNSKLSYGNRPSADVLGTINTERNGERLQAEFPITLNGLEIIDNGNAEASNRVEDGKDPVHRLVELTENGLTTPPGEGNVTGAEGKVTGPTILLQLERRGGVNVRDETSKDTESKDGGELMAGPNIESVGNAKSAEEEKPDLEDDLPLTDLTGGDGAVGLVDGVDLAIVPVVDGLGVPREEGSGQDHGNESHGGILQSEHDVAIGLIEGVPHPVVVAGGGGAAHDAPNERDPGNGLGKLKADLPNVRGLAGTLDAKELADVGGSIGGLLIGPLGRQGGVGLRRWDDIGRSQGRLGHRRRLKGKERRLLLLLLLWDHVDGRRRRANERCASCRKRRPSGKGHGLCRESCCHEELHGVLVL